MIFPKNAVFQHFSSYFPKHTIILKLLKTHYQMEILGILLYITDFWSLLKLYSCYILNLLVISFSPVSESFEMFVSNVYTQPYPRLNTPELWCRFHGPLTLQFPRWLGGTLRMRTGSLKNSYSEGTLYGSETGSIFGHWIFFLLKSMWYTLIHFGKCCIFSNILLLNHENFSGTFQKFHNTVLFWKTL